MIIELIIGMFILLILAVLIALIWFLTKSPISFKKEMEDGITKIEIHANRDLDKLSIVRIEKNRQKNEFTRTDVKKGEKIEFHFDVPNAKEKIVIEFEGETKEYGVD